MFKVLFLLCSLFILINSFGQLITIPGKPRQLTEKENEWDSTNHNCFYNKKYSKIQRLQFYPFNKAAEIKLVSFGRPDGVIMGGELPMKNGNVDYSRVKEVKTMVSSQIDSLTDILFNRSYGGHFYSFSEIMCYTPRNAIVFEDAKGQTIGFIEICFECAAYRLSSKKIKAGDFCNQKYDYLRDFFAKNGIVFGVTERRNG